MNIDPAAPRTFRATTAAWLGQFALPFTFFLLLVLTAMRARVLSPLIGVAGMAAVCLIAVRDYLLPMLRSWLVVDRLTIEGSLNGRPFQIYWTEILAAWLFEHHQRRFLCLGTRYGSLMIPLRFMDHHAIWEYVRASAPPEALREDAIRRLPDFQDWNWRRDQVLQSPVPYLVTDHWLAQILGWAGLTVFSLSLVDTLRGGQILLAALFALLVLGSLSMLLTWGITEFSLDQIRRHTLLGGWSMTWDQVRWIEIDPLDSVLVLVSDDLQMVIPGPGVWRGKRREALELLLAQIERRGIPMRRTPLAALKFSHRIRPRP